MNESWKRVRGDLRWASGWSAAGLGFLALISAVAFVGAGGSPLENPPLDKLTYLDVQATYLSAALIVCPVMAVLRPISRNTLGLMLLTYAVGLIVMGVIQFRFYPNAWQMLSQTAVFLLPGAVVGGLILRYGHFGHIEGHELEEMFGGIFGELGSLFSAANSLAT